METQIVLSPVPLDSLLSKITDIVTTAVKAQHSAELGEKLLSPAETCKLFNPEISKVTLNEWRNQGLIPCYRISGRVYYKYSEVIESAKRIRKYDRDKQVA